MPDSYESSQQITAIRRPERLPETVYGRILDIISSKGLTVGDKLPPETTLAQMFAVSRPVVREALMRLRSDGIIEARQGSGSYLSRPPPRRLMSRMQPANISSGLGGYEVRLALEPYAARLAAENRSAHDLTLMKRQLGKFEKRLHSGKSALAEDLLLHRSILEATGNHLFLLAFDAVASRVHEIMSAVSSMTQEDNDKRKSIVIKEHRLIVSAIEAQDGPGAARAMDQHLNSARRRAIDGFEPGT